MNALLTSQSPFMLVFLRLVDGKQNKLNMMNNSYITTTVTTAVWQMQINANAHFLIGTFSTLSPRSSRILTSMWHVFNHCDADSESSARFQIIEKILSPWKQNQLIDASLIESSLQKPSQSCYDRNLCCHRCLCVD